MSSSLIRSRLARILIGGMTGLTLAALILGHPGHSRGAATAQQPSSQVAVIPSFAPAPYPGTQGVPPLPLSSPQLASYHFSNLAPSQVTTASLASYDTVLLYGIRWSDLPAMAQAAINVFAATHKVVIWDADDTGAQNYATFIHPFTTLASTGHGLPGASVVQFPAGLDFLASDNPSSPYYLKPQQLTTNAHMINHMNVMQTGTPNWSPGLVAANATLPQGGWVLAWAYGQISNHTGLAIYSGIDADAFASTLNPNYAIKELALDLAAPFSQTPDTTCAPGCGGGGGGGGGTTYTACSFAKKVPTHWVRGRVPIAVKTSPVAGITGSVVTGNGRTLASGSETGDTVSLVVPTKRLQSNHTARLQAVVFVSGKQACAAPFRLKVDNIPPRFLHLAARGGALHVIYLSVSEKSSLTIIAPHVHRHAVLVRARGLITLHLPASVHRARLIVRDRAGNTAARTVTW